MKPTHAPTSINAFRGGLKRFAAFCEGAEMVAVSEFTNQTFEDFERWIRVRNLAEMTIYMALRFTRRFLLWCRKSGLILWDAEDVILRHPPKQSPKPPTAAVMARILSLPNRETPEGNRDLFALEMLYCLGLRRAECSSRNIEDLNLNTNTLKVVGKGGDERLLPVGPRLKQVAQDYLFNARLKLLPAADERALFLNDEGQRLDVHALAYIVKKYGALLDLKLAPHALRHACATHLTEAGMSLENVQQLLGHRRIDSTKIYAQISTREMEREFHRAHPRSSRKENP